jgi:hypothetical protein
MPCLCRITLVSILFSIPSLFAIPAQGQTTDINAIGAVTAPANKRAAGSVGVATKLAGTYAAPADEIYLCFEVTSTRNDDEPPFRLTPVGVLNNAGGEQLLCPLVTDDIPFVQDTKLKIILHSQDFMVSGKNETLWDHVEDVGMDITSAAATAPDRSAVRTASLKAAKAAAKAAVAGLPKPKTFDFQPSDNFVVLAGQWKLQPNTAPTVALKFAYSSVTIATMQPSDILKETVIAFSPITYPAVLPKYRFNVDTGLIVSWIRNPTYIRAETAAAIGTSGQPGYIPAQYATQKVDGDLTVLPVLLFTIYFPERSIGPKLMPKERIPQPTFGLSLTSPGSDFFVGVSSELVRKVQIVGGLHIGKINSLVGGYDDPTSSAAPNVTTKFAYRGFVGVALNLDFIKSAFGK